MGLREIRQQGDPVLNKECKPVKEMTDRLRDLIDDMFDTMYEGNGCGLAAPQVGILRQICVVDIGDENQYLFINPEIVEKEGEQTDNEGCLSVKGYYGQVTRAQHIKVKALDIDMEPFEMEADDFLARAIQHEVDHLHGHLYTELVEGDLYEVRDEDEEAED
ncbi:MAG: peptide deformylase [Eubacteriales bacterium]|nr:peptide deformylase [Eubacteriales bacterium]